MSKEDRAHFWDRWKWDGFEEEENRFKTLILSTSPSIEGRTISKYLGIQHAEIVLGLGLSNNIGSGITDFFGIEDSALARKLSDAKTAALTQLKKQCFILFILLVATPPVYFL